MSTSFDQIALTPEQKQQVVDLAEQVGRPWHEVLRDALAAYRPKVEVPDESFSAVLRDLVELQQGPECDEYGVLRPTSFAFESTIQLLVNTAIVATRAGRQIPRANVSTDSQGGVRLEWVRTSHSVHVVVPASRADAGYIYHEHGSDYATEDLTPEALAFWLREIN